MIKLIQNSVMLILRGPAELVLYNYLPEREIPRASWRIPNLEKDRDILKMNKYLKRMQVRISKGDRELGMRIIQRSKSLQLLAFHRADSK